VQRLVRPVVMLALAVGLARIAAHGFPVLMEGMMEHVMPRGMGHCFSRMSPERRQFMLEHCRGLLDEMEATYTTAGPEPGSPPR
jgi:hypothetical protein